MITNCGLGIHTDKPLPERREHDHYATDIATVRRVVSRYLDFLQNDRGKKYLPAVLDPGAGSGVWGQELKRQTDVGCLMGVEIRNLPAPAGYDGWITGDLLPSCPAPGWWDCRTSPPRFALVIGNPPYKCAEQFVRRGLSLLHNGGHVVFLLRLAFLEGKKRRDGLFREHPPREVWVHSQRPSFDLSGKSNATAYATFVWEKGWTGDTRVRWLDD